MLAAPPCSWTFESTISSVEATALMAYEHVFQGFITASSEDQMSPAKQLEHGIVDEDETTHVSGGSPTTQASNVEVRLLDLPADPQIVDSDWSATEPSLFM